MRFLKITCGSGVVNWNRPEPAFEAVPATVQLVSGVSRFVVDRTVKAPEVLPVKVS